MSSARRYGASTRSLSQPVAEMQLHNGSIYIDNTAVVAGNFCAITVLAAAVAALVANEKDEVMGGTLSAVTLPVGVTIYGHFTSITLASGKVIAYKR